MLVHNLGNSKTRMDSFCFECLNDNDHPLIAGQFQKIIAFVNDVKFSKKRLIGRSARYSGLLDVLEFRSGDKEEAVPGDGSSVPTKEQLSDVDSVMTFASEESEVLALIDNSVASKSVKSITILLANNPSASTLEKVKKQLDKSTLSTTLIAMGEIDDAGAKEGNTAFRIAASDSGDAAIPPSPLPTMPIDEAIRIMIESSTLECADGKTFSVYSAQEDSRAVDYLKAKRSQGYTRGQEIGDLILGGMEKYDADLVRIAAEKEAKEKEEVESTKKVELNREDEIKELIAKGRREYKEFEERKIEEEGKDFLAREWRSKFFSKSTSSSEEEYIKENYERGMKEGSRIVNMMRGTPYEGKDEHMKDDEGLGEDEGKDGDDDGGEDDADADANADADADADNK